MTALRSASLLSVAFALLLRSARAQTVLDVEIQPPPPREVGFDQNIGKMLPLDATFRDELGNPVRLGDSFSGKPVVLSFAYDTCPMLCNLSMEGLATSLKGLNLDVGNDFNVVTVSFDPRDTPERSRAKKEAILPRYGRPGAARGWRFLTGDESEIRRVTGAAGFRYTWDEEAKQYAHPAGIVVVTPAGQIARYLFGIEYAPKDLRLSLVEASQGRLGGVVDQLLLLCYHYDPKAGKYGPVAIGAMRAAGMLTLVSLGAFVTVMVRRERKSKKRSDGDAERGGE
jgi:protein SCO1/2